MAPVWKTGIASLFSLLLKIMKLSAIIDAIEGFAPLSLQEKWDNSGLQIGLPDGNGEVTGVLICLDTTEAIVAEAIERGCNLIVSHHPLIFKGFKHLTASTPQERAAAAAIRGGVAVYSAHTSLDSTVGGVSYAMASLLGAETGSVIEPAGVEYYTVSVICPRRQSSDVRLVLLDNEPACTYADVDGESADLSASGFDPVAGIALHHEPLTEVRVDVDSLRLGRVLAALAGMPGYDNMKVSVVPVRRRASQYGLGVYATLPGKGLSGSEFVAVLRKAFGTPCIKASASYSPDRIIRRIALCSGSAPDFIGQAARAGVDAYVTADVRYHDFADCAAMNMIVFDVGHFESEYCAKDIFYHVITKKIANFAVYKSETETNPVNYL